MKFIIYLLTFLIVFYISSGYAYANESVLSVKITDGKGRPMVRMRTELSYPENFRLITDEEGKIKIPLSENFPSSILVTTRFEYVLKDETAFAVGITNDDGVLMHVKNTFEIPVNESEVMEQTLVIQSKDQGNLRYNDPLTTVYQYLSDSVRFYDRVLSVYDEFDIPSFYVACYGPSDSTFYFDNISVISEPDMPVHNENAPQNREWHEYNHHILFHLHDKWPQSAYGYEKNHAGFLNGSTSDSYVEGFAEFMSLMVGEHTGYSFKDIYRPIGSMELDYMPVDYAGTAEEFAIAGVLWDLYDGFDDDPLQMPIKDIWNVLSSFNNDFTAVYEKLISRYPKDLMKINQVFVNHGFFINQEKGNGRWDFGEPYIGWPNRYKPGDYFIDLPLRNGKIAYEYKEGDKIGSAGDWSRPYRRTTMAPAGHCIKTKNKSLCYIVDVDFDNESMKDYSMRINNVNGEIKFALPPERFGATVTVKPDRMECKKILTIRSDEFYNMYQKSVENRYYVNHDFSPVGNEAVLDVDSYRYYTDSENDEAIMDKDGKPVTVFFERKKPNLLTQSDSLEGPAIPIIAGLVILWLWIRKKVR